MTSPATGRPAHNRRTAYTKTAIRRTFFELLEEKDFDKISVREICQRADINRSTFYRHYDDINALMKSIEAEFVSDIDNQIERMDPEVFDAVLVGLFDIVRDNSDLCCYMMRCGPRKGFINSLFVKNYDRTQIKWKKFFPEITDKQLDVYNVLQRHRQRYCGVDKLRLPRRSIDYRLFHHKHIF